MEAMFSESFLVGPYLAVAVVACEIEVSFVAVVVVVAAAAVEIVRRALTLVKEGE